MQQQDLSNKSPEEIRAQMAETLSSLVSKAESMQTEVRETVIHTKDKLRERIEQVSDLFSLKHHVEQRPWTMLAGAVVTGVLLRRIIDNGRDDEQGGRPAEPSVLRDRFSSHNSFPIRTEAPKTEPATGVIRSLASEFRDEISNTKRMAIGTGVGLLRALAKNTLPRFLGSHIDDLAARTECRWGASRNMQPEPQRSV